MGIEPSWPEGYIAPVLLSQSRRQHTSDPRCEVAGSMLP